MTGRTASSPHPGATCTVLADRAMVGKILDNLLNNALTYSDHAPIIRMQARRNAGQMAITVADDAHRGRPRRPAPDLRAICPGH